MTGTSPSFFAKYIILTGAELNQDLVKLDRYCADDLEKSPLKQQILESLVQLFGNSTEIILEGIKTEGDLNTAKLLGVKYGQGYLLERPSAMEYLSIKDDF